MLASQRSFSPQVDPNPRLVMGRAKELVRLPVMSAEEKGRQVGKAKNKKEQGHMAFNDGRKRIRQEGRGQKVRGEVGHEAAAGQER